VSSSPLSSRNSLGLPALVAGREKLHGCLPGKRPARAIIDHGRRNHRQGRRTPLGPQSISAAGGGGEAVDEHKTFCLVLPPSQGLLLEPWRAPGRGLLECPPRAPGRPRIAHESLAYRYSLSWRGTPLESPAIAKSSFWNHQGTLCQCGRMPLTACIQRRQNQQHPAAGFPVLLQCRRISWVWCRGQRKA
jgi:hypothetical protein